MLGLFCSAAAAAEEDSGFGITPFGGATYSKETSLMFGVAAILYYKHPQEAQRRDSSVMVAAAYSLRNQSALMMNTELFLLDDRLQIESLSSVARFPDSYFGIGNATSLDDEERYTPFDVETRIFPRWRVHPRLYLGPALRAIHVDVREVEEGGALARADVPGAGGGSVVQVGVGGMFDTRDNTLYPYRGIHATWAWMGGLEGAGSKSTTTLANANLRWFIPMPFERHVLALQGYLEVRSGDVPFYDMGKLGGDQLLRGHFYGRYRDRQLWVTQAEYRMPLVWRFGVVGFAGLGDVAHDLEEFRADEAKYGVGGGLRFAPDEDASVNIRLDLAKSADDFGVYVNVGEAF